MILSLRSLLTAMTYSVLRFVRKCRQSIRFALFGSYVVVFGVVLFSTAAIVRIAFEHGNYLTIHEEVQVLSHNGEDAIEGAPNKARVAAALARVLKSSDEGLEWFDAGGNRVIALGLMRNVLPSAPSTGTLQASTPLVGSPRGWVRATISDKRLTSALHQLDIGLLSGLGIALIIGASGGSLLASQAVHRIEQTLERMREFTADAAHELRSPLAVIRSNVDAISDREPDARDENLDNIRHGVQRMSRTMSDLLLLARSEDGIGGLYAVNVDDVIDALAHAYQAESAVRNVSLRVEHATGEHIVYGNPDQIYRILDNLLSNAFRYTGDGGSVKVAQTADRHFIIVAVSDTGVGIAPASIDKVFERFWRADVARSTDGSGLGLAIARTLARRHGGDVLVESRLGQGSTFRLRLPRSL
jgi:OmpR-family two-component system manganese-sensing sensor histidine kinase